MNRILWNTRTGNDIDEIVVNNPATIHVEQQDARCWWIGITMPDGSRWAGNFTANSRGRMRFSEQENDGLEWVDDREHL